MEGEKSFKNYKTEMCELKKYFTHILINNQADI